MNVRRGLFRAWIVASVIWVLICTAGWYAWTYDDWGKLKTARECNTPDPSVIGTPKALEARNKKPWCADIDLFADLTLEAEIREISLRFGIAALLVPTSLLALGLSIAWVRRGFRQSSWLRARSLPNRARGTPSRRRRGPSGTRGRSASRPNPAKLRRASTGLPLALGIITLTEHCTG